MNVERRETELRRTAAWMVAAALAVLAVPSPVDAQEGGTATVRGTIFDSTTMRPLAGARVAAIGTPAIGTSDEDGTFRLEDVPAGAWFVSFFHERLQELGVGSPSARIELPADGEAVVDLAVPSEGTLLAAWCAADHPGDGYGALAGVVQDSVTGVAMPGAVVRVHHADAPRFEAPLIEVQADADGAYRICDVPGGLPVRVQARFGMNAGRTERVAVGPGEGVVRDLAMLMTSGGLLSGRVIDYRIRQPVPGISVSVLGTSAETVTDGDGGFSFRDLPPGRHLVLSEGLGYQQHVDSVTIFSQETVRVEVRMDTEAIELDGMVVTARSRFGGGPVIRDPGKRTSDFIDREAIEKLLPRVSAAGELLRHMNVPGLSIRETQFVVPGAGPECTGAALRNATGDLTGSVSSVSCPVVRGLCVEVGHRQGGEGCFQAAVYLNDVKVPQPDQFLLDLDPNVVARIEVLKPIDAQTQYGTFAGYGAVAIYTVAYAR